MSLPRGFTPKSEVTEEENEEMIKQLESQIEKAEIQRDYDKADKLQTEYDYCLKVRAFFQKPQIIDNTLDELNELEKQRVAEEDLLIDKFAESIDNILTSAENRLEGIEATHQSTIQKLDERFNNPHFAVLRLSPNVQALMRAEAYYVRQKNYKIASAYKYQITNRTERELNITDQAANQTVCAAIEAAVRKYEYEKRGLHQKLENDKFRMQKEAAKILDGIKFRYQKLRHQILGLDGRDPLPEEKRKKPKIYAYLNERFEQILRDTESNYVPESPVEPPIDSRPAQLAIARANEIFKEQTAQSRGSSPRTTRMSARTGTLRNPRVARALQRTTNRASNKYQTTYTQNNRSQNRTSRSSRPVNNEMLQTI